MQFSKFLNYAHVTLLAIQSVESIPHELPFFQKRYDYFGNDLLCGLLNGLLNGFLYGLTVSF